MMSSKLKMHFLMLGTNLVMFWADTSEKKSKESITIISKKVERIS